MRAAIAASSGNKPLTRAPLSCTVREPASKHSITCRWSSNACGLSAHQQPTERREARHSPLDVRGARPHRQRGQSGIQTWVLWRMDCERNNAAEVQRSPTSTRPLPRGSPTSNAG
jgi:hypothetical protein